MDKLIDRLASYKPDDGKHFAVRGRLSLKERAVEYVLRLNPSMECAAYAVDGYLVKGAKVDKCDKLILVKHKDRWAEVFVELKGSDVEHGVKQLEETLCQGLFARTDHTVRRARLVSRTFPSNSGNSVIERAKVRFMTKYGCELRPIKSGNPDDLKESDFNKM